MCAGLGLALILIGFSQSSGQSAQPSPSASASQLEQIELWRARRKNEESQSAYFDQQTERLKQPPSKSFVTGFVENPASVVGVLGALVAALVAFSTFLGNHLVNLRAQRDAKFYEALNRFGDMDSPTVRCSAAGIIAQMGQMKTGRWRKGFPYLETAFDQFMAGLRLEENLICLRAVYDGLRQLIPLTPQAAARLEEIVLELKDELAETLAEFWGTQGFPPPDNKSDRTWEQAADWTEYKQDQLDEIKNLSGRKFWRYYESHKQMFSRLSVQEKAKSDIAVQQKLRIVANRVRFSVKLLEFASMHHEKNSE